MAGMPTSPEHALNQIVALALDIGRKSHLAKPETMRIIQIAGDLRKSAPGREAVVTAIMAAGAGLDEPGAERVADAVLALLKGDKPTA